MTDGQELPSAPLPLPPLKPVHTGETTRLYALPAPVSPEAKPKAKAKQPKKEKAEKPKKPKAERPGYRVHGSDGYEVLIYDDRPRKKKRRYGREWWDERGSSWSYKVKHDELEPGTIEGDRETRKKGIWEAQMVESLGELQIYITCPKCGTIGNASDHRIDKDGALSPCLVCPDRKCDTHLFLKLKGYTLGERQSRYKGWKEEEEGKRVEREGIKLSDIDPRYLREDRDLWSGMM